MIELGYISIETREDSSKDVLHPDEIVIEEKSVIIQYDYPFQVSNKFIYHSDNGFTRKQLINIICDEYKKIYKNPEKWGVYRSLDGVVLHGLIDKGFFYDTCVSS